MRTFSIILSFVLILPSIVNAQVWEWNSGGTIDCVPTFGATWDGWGEWFITTIYNDTGYDIGISKFGFPCNYGDGSGPNQDVWCALWYNVGGLHAPPGDYTSADEYFDFDPVDDGDTSPPIIYSYVDIADTEYITINENTYFCFGYKNPGLGGQIDYNGVVTWSWHNNRWGTDGKKGRTAILQFKGGYITGIESTSLGTIKASFK